MELGKTQREISESMDDMEFLEWVAYLKLRDKAEKDALRRK